MANSVSHGQSRRDNSEDGETRGEQSAKRRGGLSVSYNGGTRTITGERHVQVDFGQDQGGAGEDQGPLHGRVRPAPRQGEGRSGISRRTRKTAPPCRRRPP